jgi:hypothetical protein
LLLGVNLILTIWVCPRVKFALMGELGFNSMSLPPEVNFVSKGECSPLCPPPGVNTLMFRRRGSSPQGANFTPREQSSPRGTNFTPVGQSFPLGLKLKIDLWNIFSIIDIYFTQIYTT